ncbi:MAG: hypothetical protein HYZ47_00290 [Simkania negevensis]|nr:hypothetical protein [Simkania negevensis]
MSNIGWNYLVNTFSGKLEQFGIGNEEKKGLATCLMVLTLASITLSLDHGKQALARSLEGRITLTTLNFITDSFLLATCSHALSYFYLIAKVILPIK